MTTKQLLAALSLALLSTLATPTIIPAAGPISGQEVSENAALKFEETHIEFGEVEEGEKVAVEYKVTNTSDKTVNITQIRPSCGCTAASGNPDKVAPGETVSIKMLFNTSGRLGDQYKAATVMTDDPQQPNYQLSFRGTVSTDLQFAERAIVLNEVEQGTEIREEFVLVSRTEKPIEIKEVTTNNEKLAAKFVSKRTSPDDPKATEYVFELHIPGDTPQGSLYSAVTVRTNHPAKEELTLPVRANIVGEVMYTPTQLVGYIPEDGTLDRFAILTARNAEKLEVISSTVPDGAPIDIKIEDMPQPNMKKVRATMRPLPEGERMMNTEISLQLKLDGEKELPLAIPTTIVVRPSQPSRPSLQAAPAGAQSKALPPKQGPALPAAPAAAPN